jgi:hypothetical protein
VIIGDPTTSFIIGQDVMRLQHAVQHEGQAGHDDKDAMFKMTSRANLAQQLTLSVSNQISIEQEGIIALISSANWLAHEMVASRKLDSLSSLMKFTRNSTTSRCGNRSSWVRPDDHGPHVLAEAAPVLVQYGCAKMWVALKRDQQPAEHCYSEAPRGAPHSGTGCSSAGGACSWSARGDWHPSTDSLPLSHQASR